MVAKDINRIEELLDLPNYLSLADFQKYIADYLERKADKKLAIEELDKVIGILQNHIFSLSLYLKQNHLFAEASNTSYKEDSFYTKQEVAIRYRVSIRTVTNWISDGLQTVEIGGVKRISEQAVLEYVKKSKTKKFHWKSTVHQHTIR
jgi:hypothetical protein